MAAHFRLFTLVSSARDTGSRQTQARLLDLHLGYWQRGLEDFAPQFRLTVFDEVVRSVLPAAVSLVDTGERVGHRAYYRDLTWRTVVGDGDRAIEVGDGGLTTWTAQLMGNAKERCLVSCLSSERLTTMLGQP